MCGIAGILGLADRGRTQDMAAAMMHRGPDDEGIELFPAQPASGGLPERPALSLGFRRLSIIDLSARGHQPMFNEDRSACIVFNGEIYNYRELREELKTKHQFQSDTDTEVILHAYEEWGVRCVEKLRGMFAFAIWDCRRGRLWLARDRLGIKPLYWAWRDGRLIFASELKAMLASGLIERRLDPDSLDCCLSFSHVPAPLTIIQGVYRLRAGAMLTVEPGQTPRVDTYWQIPQDTIRLGGGDPQREFEEARQQVRALLEEAIRQHMISDVPLGAFLSGGLDSTVIVGLMSRLVDQPIRTFCIRYGSEGRALDESGYARIASDHFGCDHTEAVISGAEVAHDFDRFIWHLDQPSVDGLNSYLVSKVARQTVTVALSGLGGDELFVGYPHVLNMARAMALRARFPATRHLPHLPLGPLRQRWPWLEALNTARLPIPEQYAQQRRLFGAGQQRELLATDLRRDAVPSAPLGEPFGDVEEFQKIAGQTRIDELVNLLSRIELRHYMAPVLLRDMDAVSMAHSLEVRPPFVDHKLAEFVCRLPAHLKLGGTDPKPLLAAAVSDLVPPAILHRRKAFFHLPMVAWMRNELRDRIEDATSDATVRRRGLFAPASVARLREEFARNPHAWPRLWMLVVLECWMRRYLDEH
ncbi:MAG: asparagine synthase (glutamine-hydrolyzing) [Verrucomicrobia bacterium]|nr:asparagine synthase (glutamine-hydrolyzing) [Verrucomicrobiota bacterium]